MSNPYSSPNPHGNFSQQPMGGGPTRRGPIPHGTVKNYLVESILLLIFCGGVLAIPALIFASQVNSKLDQGDYNGALQASKSAKTWCIVALSVGVGLSACGCILGILMALAGANA